MGIIVLDSNNITPYSLSSDTSDDKTIFKLKPLTVREKMSMTFAGNLKLMQDGSIDYSQLDPNKVMDMLVTTLRFGLVGWDNFKVRKSEEEVVDVPFDTEEVVVGSVTRKLLKRECIEQYLPEFIINELSSKILELSSLTDAQRKN